MTLTTDPTDALRKLLKTKSVLNGNTVKKAYEIEPMMCVDPDPCDNRNEPYLWIYDYDCSDEIRDLGLSDIHIPLSVMVDEGIVLSTAPQCQDCTHPKRIAERLRIAAASFRREADKIERAAKELELRP